MVLEVLCQGDSCTRKWPVKWKWLSRVRGILQGIFPTQGSNPGLPHCGQILYQLSHKGSPRILESAAFPFSSGSSQPRNRTGSPALQADSLPAEPPRMTRGIALLSKEPWEAAVWEERPWLKDQQGIQESRQIWEAGGQKERSKDGGILQRREDNSAKFCMKFKASIWTVLVTLAVEGHWWHLSRRFQVNRGAGSRLSVKTGPSD